MRLLAVVTAAALLPLAVTGTAHAAGAGSHTIRVFADGDENRYYDASGTLQVLSDGAFTTTSPSADGTRTASTFYAAGRNPAYGVGVVDAGATPVLTVDDTAVPPVEPCTTTDEPAVSFHGSVVAFDCTTSAGTRVIVRNVGGAAAERSSSIGYRHAEFDPLLPETSNDLYLLDSGATLRRGGIDGTPTTRVVGVDDDVLDFRISPTGKRILWTASNGSGGFHLVVGDLSTLSDGRTAVTGAHVIVAEVEHDGDEPPIPAEFTLDGTGVYAAGTVNGVVGSYLIDLYDGTAKDITPSFDDRGSHVYDLTVDGTPPGPVTNLNVVLDGTSADVTFTPPTDPDLSTITVGPLITDDESSFFPAQTATVPVTSFHLTGLTLGQDYPYRVYTRDRSGNETTVDGRFVATATTLTAPALSSTAGTTAPFAVRFPVADHWTDSYDDLTGTAGFVDWPVNGTGTHVFGYEGKTVAKPGHTYVLTLTVFDRYGNSSAPTTTTVAVPSDQRSMAFTGPTTALGKTTYWYGTARQLNAGSSATVHGAGSTLRIIGSRCRTCGVVDIYRDGVLLASVDTGTTKPKDRTVLWSGPARSASDTYVLKPHGTKGRPQVRLDAFSFQP